MVVLTDGACWAFRTWVPIPIAIPTVRGKLNRNIVGFMTISFLKSRT
jgi:hypothetical protein